MAKRCEICEKGPVVGRTISHAHNVTSRTWEPNLQRVRALVDGAVRHVFQRGVSVYPPHDAPIYAATPAGQDGMVHLRIADYEVMNRWPKGMARSMAAASPEMYFNGWNCPWSGKRRHGPVWKPGSGARSPGRMT